MHSAGLFATGSVVPRAPRSDLPCRIETLSPLLSKPSFPPPPTRGDSHSTPRWHKSDGFRWLLQRGPGVLCPSTVAQCTSHEVLKGHSQCHVWQSFLLSKGGTIFYCRHIHIFFIHVSVPTADTVSSAAGNTGVSILL